MDKHVKREKDNKDKENYYSDWTIEGENSRNSDEETKQKMSEPSTRSEDFLGKKSSEK